MAAEREMSFDTVIEPQAEFAPTSLRARAYLTDIVCIALVIVGLLSLADVVDPALHTGRLLVWLALAFFLFYEPLFVHFFGGTAGHLLAGLVVLGPDGRYLPFPSAVLRFVVKWLAISFAGPFTIRLGRRRALWDLPVNSSVHVRAELRALNTLTPVA